MRKLGTREQGRRRFWLRLAGCGQVDLHRLMREHLDASPAMGSLTPVSKDAREQPQPGVDGAGHSPHVASACSCHSTGTALSLGQPRDFRMRAAYTSRRLPSASVRCSVAESTCPAGQSSRPSGCSTKSREDEAASFERQGDLGWGIASSRSCVIRRRQERLSKLSRAHRLRRQLMPQFQAQGRDPLADHLPQLLSSRRMTAPTVGVLFQVFIGKRSFKGSPMQVEGHHIGRGEGTLGQLREEQFVDDAVAEESDLALRLPSGMGRDHHPTACARWPDGHLFAVVQGAHEGTFRTAELLISCQMQADLDLRSVKQLIVFAAHHKREASQVGEDGSGAILPIQTREPHALATAGARADRLGSLLPPDAALPETCRSQRCAIRAEPLMGMGLQHGGAGAHDLPALASRVARGTERAQTPLGSGGDLDSVARQLTRAA